MSESDKSTEQLARVDETTAVSTGYGAPAPKKKTTSKPTSTTSSIEATPAPLATRVAPFV